MTTLICCKCGEVSENIKLSVLIKEGWIAFVSISICPKCIK